MADFHVIDLWYQALRQPFGVKVDTNDAERLKARLYMARKDADDPALAALMIQTSPLNPTGQLYILHREIEIPDEEPSDG